MTPDGSILCAAVEVCGTRGQETMFPIGSTNAGWRPREWINATVWDGSGGVSLPRLKEIARRENRNSGVTAQRQEMLPVSGDNRVYLACHGAFQHAIVRLLVQDGFDANRRENQARDLSHADLGGPNRVIRSAERGQGPYDLIHERFRCDRPDLA